MSDNTITALLMINTIFDSIDNKLEKVCLATPNADKSKGYNQLPASKKKLDQIDDPARNKKAWYVNVSSVVPVKDPRKPLKRRKEDCVKAYCFTLDDVGDPDKAPNTPKVMADIVLETSEGNYQYVYLIQPFDVSSPEGLAYYESCQNAAGEAGLTDEGAGEVCRLFRLPNGINTKPGRNDFVTRVVHWDVADDKGHPHDRWDLDVLMESLGVEVETVDTPTPMTESDNPLAAQMKRMLGDDEILKAELHSKEDEVLTWLKSTGQVSGEDNSFYTVECPNQAQHTDGKTTAGYSPLGHGSMPLNRVFSCFHGHCKDWDTSKYLDWVAQNDGPECRSSGATELKPEVVAKVCEDLSPNERYDSLYSAMPELSVDKLPDVKFNKPDKDGNFVARASQLTTRRNVMYIARKLGITAKMDMQSRTPHFGFKSEEYTALSGGTRNVLRMLSDICQNMGMSNLAEMQIVLCEMAADNKFHPFEEYLRSLEWDGVSRYDDLLDCVTVAPGHEQAWRLYFRKWLIQCVQAACGWRDPKMIRNVLVLQGKQHMGKTTFLSELTGFEYFKEGIHLNIGGGGNKDSHIEATRHVVGELGELDSTFSKSAAGAIKAFISMVNDTFRQPYGRVAEDWPRCTSFCASVNKMEFLVDDTGSSRFWPVSILDIKMLSKTGIDLNQVWAEVFTWWLKGETWNLEANEHIIRESMEHDFSVGSQMETRVNDFFDGYGGRTTAQTSTEALETILGCDRHLSPKEWTQFNDAVTKRIGKRRKIKGRRNVWPIPVEKIIIDDKVADMDAFRTEAP